MSAINNILLTLAMGAVLTACQGEKTPADPGATQTPADQPAEAGDAVTSNPVDIGEVIATVGDINIGSKEFAMAAQRVSPADGVALSAAEKQEIIDKLVVEKILYAEAKKRNIDRDPKVQKVMINTLLRQDVYSNVRNSDFSQEELQAYFTEHNEEFVVPEKVQIKRIFIKVNDRRPDAEAKALAADLRTQIVADPTKFKDIAASNSEDPYRRRGGDLGFISMDGKPGIDPLVISSAFDLQDGSVSEPFLAGGGYNVVMRAASRERVERTFEQMKGSVLRKVKNERYKTLYDDYVNGVRGDYKIDVDTAKMNSVEVKATRRLSLGQGGPTGPQPTAKDK